MKKDNRHLRKLEKEDAHLMLEWMHDKSVVEYLQNDFVNKTMEDCENFIANSINTGNINLAIADEKDVYMGTVSLKHINDFSAEFAIVVRSVAMGEGYAFFALQNILEYAFNDLGLTKIYWCVSPENIRALRFYDKHGFNRIKDNILKFQGYSMEQIQSYIWYLVENSDI